VCKFRDRRMVAVVKPCGGGRSIPRAKSLAVNRGRSRAAGDGELRVHVASLDVAATVVYAFRRATNKCEIVIRLQVLKHGGAFVEPGVRG